MERNYALQDADLTCFAGAIGLCGQNRGTTQQPDAEHHQKELGPTGDAEIGEFIGAGATRHDRVDDDESDETCTRYHNRRADSDGL